jgi:hypothetical protein
MATPSTNLQVSKPSAAAARKRANVIGAVAGAVIGGVLGAVAVHKVRQNGGAKRLVPAKVPVLAKRAASVVKGIAHDAKAVARATAVIAADTAFQQVKNAAEQFVVDVAAGQPPTPPRLVAPQESDAPATSDATADASERPEPATARKSASGTKSAKKARAAKPRPTKKRSKASKARAAR